MTMCCTRVGSTDESSHVVKERNILRVVYVDLFSK